MPKNLYSVEPRFDHRQIPAVGILLINLGTPQAPTAQAVRPYLRQFLWDPRVIELSRPLWFLILHLFILTRRPKASARLYANIWTAEGSPLWVFSQRLAHRLEGAMREQIGTPLHVALGMTYGHPSIPAALAELKAKGCRRLLILPLYSHYSSTSTGASFDAVMKELMRWRLVPEVRTIHQYHDEPALIRALALSIRELWSQGGEPEKLVMSFHGIPERYFLNGDPYHCQCLKTGRLVAAELGLAADRYVVSFQSLFGREEWIKPYTSVTLAAMAQSGVRRVDVICPGFSVDCLETLDEIGREYRHLFLAAGGEQYRFIPCLNDRREQVELLRDLALRNLAGWVKTQDAWHPADALAAAEQTQARAVALQVRGVRADGGYGV